MTVLPIVARELRVTARRRGTAWTRTMVALVAIGVGAFLYFANIDSPPQLISQRVFLGLIAISIFFCLYAGRRYTADSLSEEKRQGTLGLLFLTDLKGYDIVLGKVAATSLNGFYCLLGVFPVLAVPILLGGISNAEFWRVVLVLANSFLFSLAVGIFVSALSRDPRQAMGANLLLLLVIIALPGACASAIMYFSLSHGLPRYLLLSCPFYSLYLCADSTYTLDPSSFWSSLGLVHALTWGLLALTCAAVRHSWQDKPVKANRFSWQALWAWLRFGPVAKRAGYRRRLLDANAFYWLAARTKFKPLHVWGVLLCVAGWWIWVRVQFGALWLEDSLSGTNLVAAIMLNVALKLWVGLEAGRQLAEERQSGSFELLLSTPLRLREILRGQWLALRRQFLAPALLSTVVALIFMTISIRHSPSDRSTLLTGWLGAILMFGADGVALFWTALYCALTTHSPNQAALSSISRIVLAPGLVFAAIVVLSNLNSYFLGSPPPKPVFYILCWIGLGLLTDLVYGVRSWQRLHTRFRQLAAFTPPLKR